MPERLRVGILGAGLAGVGHARAFARLLDVEVSALWSRTRAKAEKLALLMRRSKPQVYERWEDLVEQADVDIISLATPPTVRREPLIKALERGRHLLVEKPLCVGLADADEMLRAAGRSGTVTAICFNWRYAPGCQLLWRQARAGRIGRIRALRTEWRLRATTPEFFVQRPWVAQLESSDGTLGEGISHEFDQARFLTGCEFTQIVARMAPVTWDAPTSFTVEAGIQMHLAELSGAVLSDFRFAVTPGEEEWSVILSGETGTLKATTDTLVCQRGEDPNPVTLEIPEPDRIPQGVNPLQYTWNRLIADLVTAVRQGDVAHQSVPHLPTLSDGLCVQRAIVAARRSEEERRWVRLDE